MAASSSRAAPSWSTSSRPKATIRSCGGWASRRQRRPRLMAVKAQDLTKDYKYGFSDPEQYAFKSRRGLDHEIVRQISEYKKEPEWMRQFRLRALDIFLKKPLPTWPAANLAEIDFQNIFYYVRPSENSAEKSWDDVPPYIKETFDKLGIPEAERKFLAGVSAQYESEVVYHSIREDLEKQGVIFLDMDSGLRMHPDAGAKVVHAAPHTTSNIVSKSVSKGTGRTTYRGLVKVYPDALDVRSNVRCDALLLNEESRSDTYPYMEVEEEQVSIGHEASVSKLGEEQLFYLMSRGLKESEAAFMIVNGFMEPFTKELPLEYAVELNRLIQLEMEGSVGEVMGDTPIPP